MKKIALLIIFIGISHLINAQEITSNFQNGDKKEYFDSGRLKKITPYVNGKINGVEREYYESGELYTEVSYVNNLKNGYKIWFNKSGSTSQIYPYVNDIVNGVAKHFYTSGEIIEQRFYKQGKINGTKTQYYKSGKIKHEGNYVDDRAIGISKTFFENGQLEVEFPFVNGSANGAAKYYYQSGQLKTILPFKNDKWYGERIDYYENGQIERIANYIDSQQNGISKEYSESGKIKVEENYIGGKKNGISKTYYSSGELMLETEYKEDVSNGKENYYSEGGKIKSTSFNLNGKSHGKYTYYSEKTGKITEETTHNQGVLDGPHKQYYENGQLKLSREFKNDKILVDESDLGKYITYYSNGKIESEIYFLKGYDADSGYNNRFLKSSEYDEDGEVTRIWDIRNFHKCFSDIDLDEFDFDKNFSIAINFKLNYNNSNKLLDLNVALGLKSNTYKRLNYIMYENPDNQLYFDIFKKIDVFEGIIINEEEVPFSKYQINKKSGDDVELLITKLENKLIYTIDGKILLIEEYQKFKSKNLEIELAEGFLENLDVKIKQKINEISSPQSVSKSDWDSSGTGFFISKNGYIATNYHVVSNKKIIQVECYKGSEEFNFNAEIVKLDELNDLAIIKISDKEFIELNELPYYFSTETIDVGTSVFALGYPLALTSMGKEIKFTDGKISSKTGFKGSLSVYQMTTPLQPGNSGGPLFDYKGNLVGINFANLSSAETENVSYAIKTSYLKNLIEVLPNKIELPVNDSLFDKSLTEKIKILSEYVVLIKTK